MFRGEPLYGTFKIYHLWWIHLKFIFNNIFQAWSTITPSTQPSLNYLINTLLDAASWITAVKSNALAELMNRASKIHWKNLSLTLNGRNSETKNDKNNPKVPFFQYVQLLRNISFLLKWSFLAKICCCCQMCYFPKLSIFFSKCALFARCSV